MNCWEILGIDPTGDRRRIEQAYEQQRKFASGEEAERLTQAFREATGDAPAAGEPVPPHPEEEQQSRSGNTPAAGRPLGAHEGQVVREVVIQVKALLNDSTRSRDAGIWKAILCEPPADESAIREEIARQLEPQLRPMAENGSFPAPVAQFLGEWFAWPNLQGADDEAEERRYPDPQKAEVGAEQSPQMINFWPAVIGWIVGLAILASLFGGMGGSG